MNKVIVPITPETTAVAGITPRSLPSYRGGVAIVLISTQRMYGKRMPHWIVVYEHDSDYIFAHDPWVGREHFEAPAQKAGIAIPLPEFERMSIWGRSRLKAAVIVENQAAT